MPQIEHGPYPKFSQRVTFLFKHGPSIICDVTADFGADYLWHMARKAKGAKSGKSIAAYGALTVKVVQ